MLQRHASYRWTTSHLECRGGPKHRLYGAGGQNGKTRESGLGVGIRLIDSRLPTPDPRFPIPDSRFPRNYELMGRRIVNSVPMPGLLVTSMVPRWRSTIVFTIDRPNPLPPLPPRDGSTL